MSNFSFRREFLIEWGHCDPAGIVFNSRFFEFFDWNTWLLFEAALGVRPGRSRAHLRDHGHPAGRRQGRFLGPAKFNDRAEIVSEVAEFRRSSFEVRHRISIGGETAVEGGETRVWAARDAGRSGQLKGIPIPSAVIDRFR